MKQQARYIQRFDIKKSPQKAMHRQEFEERQNSRRAASNMSFTAFTPVYTNLIRASTSMGSSQGSPSAHVTPFPRQTIKLANTYGVKNSSSTFDSR